MPSHAQRLLALAKKKGILRARDLDAASIPRTYLKRLRDGGLLLRTGRGLYTAADAEITEHHSLAEAARCVPDGVVCLLSALRFHELGTQAPFEVWLAIDPKARAPRSDHPPLRIVRMSRAVREAGVEETTIDGVAVRIHRPAKTIADCFKFRNKIGLDVALEALRDYWRSPRRNADELWRFAKICRVANVMRPYLEALS